MNREIKFRAWLPKMRKMEYNPSAHWEDNSINSAFEIAETSDGNEMIFMQYTGLKDKNGKEICEGDILKGRCGVKLGEVKFGQFQTKRQGKQDKPPQMLGYYIEADYRKVSLEDEEWYIKPTNYAPFRGNYLEVIGNTYDNPNLIK